MRIINQNLLDSVSEQAKSNYRLRMNYNFHQKMEEPVQRLLNAIEPESYLPPHRHLHSGKQEIFLVLKGSVITYLFNDEGEVIEMVEVNPVKGVYGMEIEPNRWHAFIIQESGTVIYEIKEGPFVPVDPKDLAPWAPNPRDTEAAKAYMKKLRSLFKPVYDADKTTKIDPSAVIGQQTIIEQYTIIGKKVHIGEQCKIHRNIFIDDHVRIGNRVKIQDFVMIPHGVTIEDGVFIGPGVAFTNDKHPRAITDEGKLKTSSDWICSETLVKYGASIGANATVVCGVTIGEWAIIGAGAVVTKDVPAHAVIVGNPGKTLKQTNKS